MRQPEPFTERLAGLLEDLAEGRWESSEFSAAGDLTASEAKIVRNLERLRHRFAEQPSPERRGADQEPATADERERALVAPLIGYMVDIAGGDLQLTWDDVRAAAARSPALSEAMAGLLNLNEELRFSEEQREKARRQQVELNERLAAQNSELLREREAMASLIRDLSAVMLEVSRGVLLVPLVGVYDAARAAGVTEGVLAKIAAHELRDVILDFTGVPLVDTETARLFLQLAQGVNLLGARVVAAGIQPQVAVAMTELGIELTGIDLAVRVDQALALCLRGQRRGKD